jgi:AraC-like DNA-binding protein
MTAAPLPLDELLDPPSLNRVLGVGPLWGCVILGARPHGAQPHCAHWHRQRLFTLNLVLQGAGVFTDSSGTRHPLTPGSLYQRTRQGATAARVWIDPASDCVECFLVVDAGTFSGLKTLHLIPEQEILACGAPQLLAREYLEFRALCQRPHTEVGRRRIVAGLATWLAGLYDRALQRRGDGFWDQVVEEAARRLETNLQAKLHLPDLARELHVSYPSFRRAFARIKGLPPAEYRIRRRIEAACRLLGSHPVKEVAEQLGYCDPFTFSSQFRQLTGTSPSAFRRALG